MSICGTDQQQYVSRGEAVPRRFRHRLSLHEGLAAGRFIFTRGRHGGYQLSISVYSWLRAGGRARLVWSLPWPVGPPSTGYVRFNGVGCFETAQGPRGSPTPHCVSTAKLFACNRMQAEVEDATPAMGGASVASGAEPGCELGPHQEGAQMKASAEGGTPGAVCERRHAYTGAAVAPRGGEGARGEGRASKWGPREGEGEGEARAAREQSL